MGIKGGAAGGGYSQIVPMEDINLHFTGDFHAITAANNTLAAMIDNHIHQGNQLGIDPRRVSWQRCVDVNDRSLRHVVTGLGGKAHGVPAETGFTITAASEIMAVLCLATDLADLSDRISRMVVAQTYDGKPVTAGDVNAQGALTALLKDAINPNLVQTLGGTPAFVHGGPFANIAHGCNSLIATRTALAHADVVLTEGGFGSDLGAEKFFDIKARAGNLDVSAVVIVATIRSLKYNGGLARDQLTTENLDALQQGVANLARHVENVRKFGAEPVVALNSFTSDTDVEKQWLADWAQTNNITLVPCDVWAHGGAGATNLADAVLTTIDAATPTHPLSTPPTAWKPISPPSPGNSTTPPAWNSPNKPAPTWPTSPKTGGIPSPCASPKPNTHSATTPPSSAPPKATSSTSGNSCPASGPASSWHSPETS